MNTEKKDILIPTIVGAMAGAIAALSYRTIMSNPQLKKYATSLIKDMGERVSKDIKTSVINSLENGTLLTTGTKKKDRR